MKVRVTKMAYLDNSIRYAGDVFEWSYSGDKIPPYIEKVETAVNAEEANPETESETKTETETKTESKTTRKK